MKKVITYGTYDLLHHGHIRLLERAKALGDHLTVGVTSESFDKNRGKLNVHQSCLDRVDAVRHTGLADEIIIEEYIGQKIDDILKYDIDVFAIGSDWRGKFDYLKEFCDVVYLDRTKGVSSTQLRTENQKFIQLGLIGSGRSADVFVPESKFVSGINVLGAYNPMKGLAKAFSKKNELSFSSDNFDDFIKKVDAVYITSPQEAHPEYVRNCLHHNKHVMCKHPLAIPPKEITSLYELARKKNLVLLEVIKTAFAPAFTHLTTLVKSGAIGNIKDIECAFTKLTNTHQINQGDQNFSSINSFGGVVLLPIVKLLSAEHNKVHFFSHIPQDKDTFTRGFLSYDGAVASFKVGSGVKTEGDLVISGTRGYAYVPAPWWKTEYFELRFEDLNETKKYFYKFDGDGDRYAIHEFLSLINNSGRMSHKLSPEDSVRIAAVLEAYKSKDNITKI